MNLKTALVAGALLLPIYLFAQNLSTPTESGSGLASKPAEINGSEAPGNLFENGDFSHGKSGWKSNGSVVALENGRKALRVEFNSRRPEVVRVSIRPKREAKFLLLTFKAKITDRSSGKPQEGTINVRISNPREGVY